MLLLWFSIARAADGAERLAEVDGILSTHGASRKPRASGGFCPKEADRVREMPGLAERGFLCDDSERVSAWTLTDLLAEGGGRVDAHLELRRFTTPSAATEARDVAVAVFGRSGGIHIDDGAIAWCYAEAVWEGDLLWTLEYGCHVSVPHVAALREVRLALLASGEVFRGAVGVQGWHSGQSWLIDDAGARVEVPLADRYKHHVRVRGVADDDVLHVRRASQAAATAVGRLAADARCVPLLYGPADRSWWRVDAAGNTGWASAAFLEREPAGVCP